MTITQDHKVTRELELAQSVVEGHEVTQSPAVVDYIREMKVKKSCRYGEYELLEHLLLAAHGTMQKQ